MGYYQTQVRNMVAEDKLELYLILAVPRSASTTLEASFSMNPLITGQCHEAGDNLREGIGDVDAMYKSIYTSADGDMLWPADVDKKAIVVKEMTHRIGAGTTFRELLQLTKVPPIFLIRNPLLSMESRMKKVLHGLSLRPEEALIAWLNDESNKNGREFYQSDEGNLSVQIRMLDNFARTHHMANWSEFLLWSEANRDYKRIGEIFKAEGLFKLSRSGWEDMEQQIRHLRQTGRDYTVVDSTEFRAAPGLLLPTLCSKWELPYDHSMVAWEKKMEGLQIKQDEPYQRIWYDRVLASTEIQPPDEIPAPLAYFPEHIADYLRFMALPSYLKIAQDENRITNDEDILEMSFRVEGDTHAHQRFHALGYQGQISTDLTLRDIDPIFAVGKQLSLLQDEEFLMKNQAYWEDRTLSITYEGGNNERGRRR